jgi:hypothetical protein
MEDEVIGFKMGRYRIGKWLLSYAFILYCLLMQIACEYKSIVGPDERMEVPVKVEESITAAIRSTPKMSKTNSKRQWVQY